MSRPVSFEVFSHVDYEISLYEVDVAGKEHLKGSVPVKGTLKVDSEHLHTWVAKTGDTLVSRYHALKKYPQWHIFADENIASGTVIPGSSQTNKMETNLIVGPELYRYMLNHSLREHPILKLCRDETLANPNVNAFMQTAPEEAQFLGLMVKATKTKKAIEVGVFTGYSSLAIALNLPQDGKLVALDINEEWTNFAKGYWEKAGVAHRVELHLGPAVAFLDDLISRGDKELGTYDFAFIDADKPNYQNYFDRLLKLVRIGGIIAIDNVLWHGAVIKTEDQSESTVAIRNLNDALAKRGDIDISMLAIGDGVTFVMRKS
jgi:caffeoyl-CoA O-methyltransferase